MEPIPDIPPWLRELIEDWDRWGFPPSKTKALYQVEKAINAYNKKIKESK